VLIVIGRADNTILECAAIAQVIATLLASTAERHIMLGKAASTEHSVEVLIDIGLGGVLLTDGVISLSSYTTYIITLRAIIDILSARAL
jgi:hypothetical protein